MVRLGGRDRHRCRDRAIARFVARGLMMAAGAVVLTASVATAETAHGQTPASNSTPAPAVAAGNSDGEALFRARCGICHLAGGTGTFMLGRRLGASNALLAERTNLDPAYVKHVVRNGIVSMPRITRAEVSDAELQAIVAYLRNSKKE
jgi:mono/diheme cytochrome c family protein